MVLFSIVIYFLFFIVSLGCACMYEMYTNVCKISFDHVPVCVAVQSYSYFVLSSSQPKKTKKNKKNTSANRVLCRGQIQFYSCNESNLLKLICQSVPGAQISSVGEKKVEKCLQ